MITGQTFTVDAQAVKEMAKFYKRAEDDESLTKLEGVTYSIAKSKTTKAVTDDEVRGTKWVDGKPQRGRPRKFPRATVARLLNELDDASLQPKAEAEEDSVKDEEAELEKAAEEQLVGANAPTEDASSDDDAW